MIIFQQHQAAFPPPAYPFGLLPQPAPTFKCPWCPAVFDNREVKLDSNFRLSTFLSLTTDISKQYFLEDQHFHCCLLR